jgi:hypothetical protein
MNQKDQIDKKNQTDEMDPITELLNYSITQ